MATEPATPDRNPVTPSNPNPKVPGDQGKTPGNTPPAPPPA